MEMILLIDNTVIFYIHYGQITKSTANMNSKHASLDPVEWFCHPKLHWLWHYQKEAK